MSALRYSFLFHPSTKLCCNRLTLFTRTKKTATSVLADLEEDKNSLSVRPEQLKKDAVRAPFVKTLLLGEIDKECLAFPEFLGEKRIQTLNKNLEVIQKFFQEHIKSEEIESSGNISAKVLKKIADLKLFGLAASKDAGGLDLSNTELARLFEVISEDSSVAAFLFNHVNLGLKLIAKYGDDFHQESYLKPLINGEILCTSCFGESEAGSDASYFQTFVTREGSHWKLSGKKCWVMSGDKADLFIVFAKVRRDDSIGEKALEYSVDNENIFLPEDIGLFLVKKEQVKVCSRLDTFSLKGCSFHEVIFENVLVPDSHVLANFKKGYHIVRQYMSEDRHLLACLPLAILKKVQSLVVNYSIEKKILGQNLYSYGITQKKISNLAVTTYTIESLLYFTTGIMDMFENQDVEVESAIVKVYSTEAGFDVLNESMAIMGSEAMLESSPFYRYLRDMRFLSLMDSSNNLYKSFIALNGLQFLGVDLRNTIVEHNRQRWLTNPKKTLQRMLSWDLLKREEKRPVLDLYIKEHLHPSLEEVANELEYCIIRLGLVSKNITSKNDTTTVVGDQLILKRLADCLICLYTIIAVVSRASRSYCIGHRNSDEEMVIAETVLREQMRKFESHFHGLSRGEHECTDAYSKYIAYKSVHNSKPIVDEPLKPKL